MTTSASENIFGVSLKVFIGAFLCFGVVFFIIGTVIILSLISLYTPNHGEEGFGEHYKISTLFLEVKYQNISDEINGGTIVDSKGISDICNSVYRTNGARNFIGCVAQNFRAFRSHNAGTSGRRRRASETDLAEIYEFGEVNLYYSTSCSKKNDQLKYVNSTSIISNSTEWKLSSSSFSQTIHITNISRTITVTNLQGIPFEIALSLADNSSLFNSDVIKHLQLGCRYIGALPKVNITNSFIFNQTIETSTAPYTSTANLG